MRKLTATVGITVCRWDELNALERHLFNEAIKVRANAQAPYSHYKVGCAIVAKSPGGSKIFLGVNSEVNSWSQTTHAEQSAISNAITNLGSARILSVTVVGAPENEGVYTKKRTSSTIERVNQVCPSCGHCLQIILENCFDDKGEYDPSVVLMGASDGEFYKTTIGDALPMPFLPQYLGTNYVKLAEKTRNK